MEAETKICNICTDAFTHERRKKIECPKCGFECCLVCLKNYILTGNDPMCMSPDCRASFPDSFLYNTFPQTFLKGPFKSHRTDNLFDRERSLLEATMPYVEAQMRSKEVETELEILKNQEKKIKRKIREQKNILYALNNHGIEAEKIHKTNYLKNCPDRNCEGFLNSAYKCELCKQTTCSKCFEIKGENHICNPNNLKTAELLRKDTKSCPNCCEMIHKIEGCNQMYCTKCHTGFDWKTLKIVTGTIHNPHFFEYQRQNGGLTRAHGDIPCGGLPIMVDIQNKIATILNYELSIFQKCITIDRNRNRWNPDQINDILVKNPHLKEGLEIMFKIRMWMQATTHVRNHEIPILEIGTVFNQNLDTRIAYMMKEIDETKFKNYIIKKDSDIIKKREISHIYITFCTLIEEQMRKMMDKDNDIIHPILDECDQITKYINGCLHNLACLYKRKMPYFKISQVLDKNMRMTIEPYGNNPC
jgi:hypothetical protein